MALPRWWINFLLLSPIFHHVCGFLPQGQPKARSFEPFVYSSMNKFSQYVMNKSLIHSNLF